MYTEAPGRRELTIIIIGITITNDTLNVEVSEIGAEITAYLT